MDISIHLDPEVAYAIIQVLSLLVSKKAALTKGPPESLLEIPSKKD